MGVARDWTGETRYKLTFIRATDIRIHRAIMWEAKCECGNIRIVSPCLVVLGAIKSCGDEKCNMPRRKTTESWKQEVIAIFGDTYDYSLVEYVHCLIDVTIICRKHGPFEQKPSHHLRGDGCVRCGNDVKVKTTTQFVEEVRCIFGDLYDLSLIEYRGCTTPVTLVCRDHGHFDRTPYELLRCCGCHLCITRSVSQQETLWLNSLGVPNDQKHRQVPIMGKRVDGFDPKTNTVYEFYGDYWHGHPTKYKAGAINEHNRHRFGTLYKWTMKREALLKEAGHIVISIWESDFLADLKKQKAG